MTASLGPRSNGSLRRNRAPRRAAEARADVVILSSSLLVDRMLTHTAFLDVLGERTAPHVWATSAANPRFTSLWAEQPATVRSLPEVRAFRESTHNFARRVNEAVWDYRQGDPSRASMRRHRRVHGGSRHPRFAELLARGLAALPVERLLEDALGGWLRGYERSPESTALLRELRPAALLCTGPFQFEQPAIVASAQRLGVPTLTLIPSWDNVSTKNRMLFQYDGYLVWSERTRQELHERYPHTRTRPVYVVGAPQFDVFFQWRYHVSREAFCAANGLRPDRPFIVYAVGSPNFLKGEPDGAEYLARRVAAGDLGDVQLLVRPHPIHDNAEMASRFAGLGDRVRLQATSRPGTPLTARSQDEGAIVDWVNTFRHADVVVNLSSTVTIDAAIFDRPIVNLDYDPAPGGADTPLIRDINHVWTHFAPVAESGGVWLVKNGEEMVAAVRGYLENPALHRERRRWIAEYVCGHLDGRNGERMARAVASFARERIARGGTRHGD
ncbi:MAG: hypothetical protein HOQ12_12200 [Gemmatimonadaceae bacterium]|nr:hypothetical protein [Gemmatimonadaceae bacterium]NUQ91447.1 hypothetical protein [Gemmatimonadaceae bacterium]NUR20285.1 hypothetical protein [Gemmatimonadaceae bacterium]